MEENVTSVETRVFLALREAFGMLIEAEKSRELSLVLTKLEEAMMWLNKDRVIKGQLQASETHVHQPRV